MRAGCTASMSACRGAAATHSPRCNSWKPLTPVYLSAPGTHVRICSAKTLVVANPEVSLNYNNPYPCCGVQEHISQELCIAMQILKIPKEGEPVAVPKRKLRKVHVTPKGNKYHLNEGPPPPPFWWKHYAGGVPGWQHGAAM